jgi:toxin ParE1/3/4
MQYKIYTAAKKQLVEIWQYTEAKWGEEQANNYISGIYSSIVKISSSPELWRLVKNDKIKNVFYCRYGKHFIFFRSLSDKSVGIISILHERMNLPERLKHDYNKAKIPNNATLKVLSDSDEIPSPDDLLKQ